ncbi:MAG: peptidoglycan DD-metalloendopeptidase family protein [Gammaproteobacteria bacterium]|jgi:murein DD-endopeptidase MepM/ murein hydrolase activator NlpD|nr:peptidoglycan DD-metalloendopeptidase family protein [Gammaproteobacteria bacterium]MBT6754546.1 peptidoglycan DD-metalloendopeptidase family protein [Gammaproteobacteria bacterium]MBT7523699.1 peptidoglycan DD-metalloendopeptidase family protein [Gammaproteobacteria bacterium]
MKELIIKYRKIIISIIIIFLSIFLYSNKPYSLYDINYLQKINKKSAENSKDFYLDKMKKTINNNDSIEKKIFYVKKNQNLGYILEKVGIQTPNKILEKKKNNCLYNIYVNDKITIESKGKKLYSIERKNNSISCIYKTEDNSIKKVNKNLEADQDIEQYIFFNNIDNSFYKSALKSGLSPNEIMSLADIFGWDIDFSLEIRKGDSFGVVIDRRFLGEKYIGSDIKYAVFKNKKKVIEAYRYKKKYYNFKGVSLQKQFLKAPVDFYRISSHFNKKRLHPIFKTARPHLGTDYAAPKGTPVYSTGDGTIIYKGRKGGYGNTIIVKHGNIYSTLYAHFSKYKKGTYVGKKVKQKEIIGYVGSTGYATGPHVHYEFRVRGIHKNVLKIKFKKGKRLNKKTINKMKSIHQKNIPIYLWLNKTM